MIDFDVFISYSSQDKVVADAACAALESTGIRCWIAPRDIVPGREYGEALIEAIDNCRVMTLIFSSNANSSHQVSREVERAISRGVPVVPLRIEDVPPTKAMAYFVGSVHWLDALTPPLEAHLRKLSATIRSVLNAEGEKKPKEAETPRQLVPVSAIASEGARKPAQAAAESIAPRRILTGLAILLVAALGFGAWRAFSPRTPVIAAEVLIQGHPDAGGKCVDVAGGQIIPGNSLIVYDCRDSTNQVFAYENQLITIGGLCVDALGGAGKSGDAVGLWTCNGEANQHWTIAMRGDYFEVVGINGLCLDITGGGLATDGAPLELYPCHGQANQLWTFRPK
jgi:hypothetical protein